MKKKNLTLLLFLFFAVQLFSQKYVDYNDASKTESNNYYLDSIKKSFLNHNLASCIDSLWLKELTDLALYNDLSNDIKTINIDEKVDYELPTELLKERLAAMDSKSPFNIEYNVGLENVIKSFLKYRKKSFSRLMAVSEYYFPIFEEAFAKQNVPLEIKYLAIVESALNPKAVSKMGATGLWQFMYQTGKQYHLNIDSYVDERSDPLKSSEAAAQYMATMYSVFSDWDLVLASYNSGPGNVTKAIRRSGGQKNYWNIRKNLPKETQGYLPAFLATMYIYEYHNEHGIKPERAVLQHFATDTILIKKQMSFKQISDLLDVPVAQLQLLNPSYKMNVIPCYGDQNHFLRLPREKIAVFASNEEKIYAYIQRELDFREKPYNSQSAVVSTDSNTSKFSNQRISESKTRYYTVKKGDNLSQIANKYLVSVNDIKKWNKLKGNAVASGKSLKIITVESVVQSTSKELSNDDTDAIKENKEVTTVLSNSIKNDKLLKVETASAISSLYIVQKGDNLFSIAKKNNVSVAEIVEWNHLSGAAIKLGTALQVTKNDTIQKRESNSVARVVRTENVEYIVKKGDNLGNIAKKFGSTIDDLKEWNDLQGNAIVLGNSLIVAKSEVVPEPEDIAEVLTKKQAGNNAAKKNESNYFVQKGDSLYSISKKYPGVSISDIKKWNNIKGEELKPGMKLKING